MTYNIHPILVHFPIAFLFIYSLIKILPMSRWFPNVSWRQIERVLLVVGVLGACAALATGDTAEHLLVQRNHQLIEAHSTFGVISTFIFGALLLGEITAFYNSRRRNNVALWLEKVLCNRLFSALLALVGLVCISLTGLLGGVIVYGVGVDPFAPIVLKMLGITFSK
jgi:uncharacterized membrane protein